jgi:hypothetical protein
MGDGVTKAQFDNARIFSEGIASVKVANKWGYIDKQGKYVWKPTI